MESSGSTALPAKYALHLRLPRWWCGLVLSEPSLSHLAIYLNICGIYA